MLRQFFLIFLGGGVGSVLRYAVSLFLMRSSTSFPWGTFVANILGSLLIGFFAGYFLKSDGALKFLLIAGLCGGFTTFSTFSLENLSLIQNGQFALAAANIFGSIILGVLAVYLGTKLAAI